LLSVVSCGLGSLKKVEERLPQKPPLHQLAGA
jgi:hypothetical protein